VIAHIIYLAPRRIAGVGLSRHPAGTISSAGGASARVVAWDAARGVQFVTLPGSPPLGVCWRKSLSPVRNRYKAGLAQVRRARVRYTSSVRCPTFSQE
jgi:hypothetical protein